MTKYVLKRIGMALLTLLIIVFLLFLLVRIMPGNPFPSERMNAQQIANKRAELGLDDPILTQFWNYLTKLLQGDFGKGTSLYNGAPIKTVLATCVSNSFRIGGLSVLLGTLVGLLPRLCAASWTLSGSLLHCLFDSGRLRSLLCVSNLPAIQLRLSDSPAPLFL